MRFVLFDIDGTLLSTRGAGRRAMEAALLKHFGTTGPAGYGYDGKTDRQIARDLMREAGFADHDIDVRMDDLLASYLTGLERELAAAPHTVEVMRGVQALLDALAERPDVVLGLLTGNIEGGARAKLTAANLPMVRFRVGAFGSDDERRAALPAIARERACAIAGCEVRGDALVIIGDTPADMTCGLEIGARAIGVATGPYEPDVLRAHSPSAVFSDFTDTERVVDAILAA